MMLKLDRFVSVVAISFLAAGAAHAQAGSGQPAPGTGNSTQITTTNRETNAQYNHVIGTTDAKNSSTNERPKAPGKAVPAAAADIKAGAALRDSQGVRIGTIETADAAGAVVNTGQTKIKVPLSAFGKDDQGLLLGITAARFNELIAKAHSSN
jgi:hypothetical protein